MSETTELTSTTRSPFSTPSLKSSKYRIFIPLSLAKVGRQRVGRKADDTRVGGSRVHSDNPFEPEQLLPSREPRGMRYCARLTPSISTSAATMRTAPLASAL